MKRNKGLGFVYQPVMKDRKTKEKRPIPTWWISLSHRGKRVRVSSHSTNRADAVKLLKQKISELGAGREIGPSVDKTKFEDLITIIQNDYRANERKTKLTAQINHLRDFFGGELARDITADRVVAFVASRREAKAANASINRELSALKRAFRLAHRAGRVASVPHISQLVENNTRRGFFEREQFEAVMRHLPEDLRPVVHVAYLTGWRVTSELLTRRRQHLDLKSGWLRLEPGETKNKEGRNFPLTAELRVVLEAQATRTRELEVKTGTIIPFLFHRGGKQIKDFRVAFRSACKAAGVPGRFKHDFRRTACRYLERKGISRSAAMKMVGHLTESIYRRYAIADEVALKEAALKIDAAEMSDQGTGELVKAQSKQPAFAGTGGRKVE